MTEGGIRDLEAIIRVQRNVLKTKPVTIYNTALTMASDWQATNPYFTPGEYDVIQ